MPWFAPPREVAAKQTEVLDGRQGFIALPSGTGAGGPNLAGTVEQDGSFANYSQNAYGRNELAYACIRYRAESLPQSTIQVYPAASGRTDNDAQGPPKTDHRLRQLFAKPNDVTNEFEFFELSVTYKDLAGTCFWLVVKGRDGIPSQLWPLRPDLLGVLPNPRNPADYVWIYRPNPEQPEFAVPIPDAGSPRALRSETFIIRVRYPNPWSSDPGWRYFGRPPLRPAARVVTMDNAATDFVDTLLRNHAMPSVVIETQEEINDTLHKRLSAKWREAFGGRRRGTPAFLQKGMKIHELGLSLTDLEFPDLRSMSETRVCMAFGVEPILVGAKIGLEHNAYKDYREARLSFWEEAMFSEQRRFIEPVRSWLLPYFTGAGRPRISVGWDNSGVLALREAEQSRWTRALDALARGAITRNDFRTLVGLAPVPGGDLFLMPAGVVERPVDAPPVTAEGDIGLVAAEFGIELSRDEFAVLRARMGEEG